MQEPTSERTYKSTPLALSDVEIAAIHQLAALNYEGNRSMAARAMIRHFVTCQFPSLGLNILASPEPVEQPA